MPLKRSEDALGMGHIKTDPVILHGEHAASVFGFCSDIYPFSIRFMKTCDNPWRRPKRQAPAG